jgi:hypothetical protein
MNTPILIFFYSQVGVQCVVDPDAGSSALEDKVDSVLPLQNKGQSMEEK